MKQFYYVYVLLSEKDNNFYTGYTEDLKSRFERHDNKFVKSTRDRGKLTLIYSEACLSKKDAMHREKYLKTAWGRRYLRKRIGS